MSSSTESLGSLATSVSSNFASMTQLITAASYLAGIGFSAASIAKFKAHKDNPTQIPVGTPAALMAVSAALTFLPSVSPQLAAEVESSGITEKDVENVAKAHGVTEEKVEAAAMNYADSQS